MIRFLKTWSAHCLQRNASSLQAIESLCCLILATRIRSCSIKVVGVERDQALLPEVPFLDHMTRALLGQSGGARARVRRQYHVSSSDNDARDRDVNDNDASDSDGNEFVEEGSDAQSDMP